MAPSAEEPVLRILEASKVHGTHVDPVCPKALEQAKVIVQDVREHGEVGLKRQACKLGDLKAETDSYTVSKEVLKSTFEGLDKGEQELLERTAQRIKTFAEAQRNSVTEVEIPIPGGKAGQTIAPVATAGCYAPGGRYPLPSSVLMTAITARVAGVPTVVVASPRPAPTTLAAAYVAGADAFLCVGGAQAIAAMAEGVGDVPACDVIVGPGNRWVTAAKSLVQGRCSIDMLAGPSEVLVIADETANADIVAADLLAQAEHDVDARPILVSTDADLVTRVNAALRLRLSSLPTRDTAREAVKEGFAVVCASVEEALAVSDKIAPEHLEIQTRDSQAVADRCNNYGGLFIGEGAAEVLGDYGAGPNHVLPTGGTGRYTGGLSVFNFLRVRTWMRIDDKAASEQLVKDSVQLGRIEGLEGHARAAECRLPKEGGEGEGANGSSAAKKQKV